MFINSGIRGSECFEQAFRNFAILVRECIIVKFFEGFLSVEELDFHAAALNTLHRRDIKEIPRLRKKTQRGTCRF